MSVAAAVKDRRTDALGDLRVLPDEILCSILTALTPHDVARLSCVSSVMYILCNEEPLWMSLCLGIVNRQLEYKGSWKKTALHQLDLLHKYNEAPRQTLQFDGFSSLFLYRRMYRCHTSLNGFSFDDGNVERKPNITFEEFHMEYDSQNPVMISGLADNWPARKSWTCEELLLKYPETKFRISQKSSKKISMNFKNYVSYMQIQHDEDPLYIFDDKFGEVAPDLLKDYSVPHIFLEDYFDVLDTDQRPPYRWFIIGPERSGASWHVDPGLTSAWNTLLYGRKRWALYPPGRVPLGVTMHVNEDNGDVNIETPSSLQWWLDFYPLLADNDKPIECTQLPGETIYVPSGWWHCVLNLETTIAVTQNFVNSKNFEFVCLDMAPGYRHKGVCRAGMLALDDSIFEDIEKNSLCIENGSSYFDLNRREKRLRIEDRCSDDCTNGMSISDRSVGDLKFSYDISFLTKFLDRERDHYNSLWSSGNCIGQRELRDWLWKLWVGRPGLRDLIWKGACLALNVGKWYECAVAICSFHEFPRPSLDEKLPVGTGSNPVYLVDDYVIKIFVEDGLEASLYCLGTELEFYNLVHKLDSSLKNCIPSILASGILFSENGSYRLLPWDGRGMPELVASSSVTSIMHEEGDYPFGLWAKKKFEYQNAGRPLSELGSCAKASVVWPYIVTRRCKGKMFAELRNELSSDDELHLASFLGKQLHDLHLLPLPHQSSNDSALMASEDCLQPSHSSGLSVSVTDKMGHPAGLELFISILNRRRKDVASGLAEWGDPIPSKLIEKVDEYIPHDLHVLFHNSEHETECRPLTWIHSDVMDDNIYMIPCNSDSMLEEEIYEPCVEGSTDIRRSNNSNSHKLSWVPSYILDFSNLSAGEPILDLIPLYLDVFRGDPHLLKHFLNSYKLPFVRRKSLAEEVVNNRFDQLSYRAMCYCILHDENVLGAIFSIWKELRLRRKCGRDENENENDPDSAEDENDPDSAVAIVEESKSEFHSPQSQPTSGMIPSSPGEDGVDTILMVPEDGDPPVSADNHYKSSSALEVKSDNASSESRDGVSTIKHDKTEAKIVARPSTDDDYAPSVSSPFHRRCVSADLVAKVPTNYGNSSPQTTDSAKVSIDTAAPIESVKSAVSKFGGIVDWKAHRVHTMERRKFIEQELDKAHEEMPLYKQQCEAANEAKSQVLKQLESTKRLIEELKLNLERAQTEEQQAKQDSELAKLRVEEMEQGIADESSFAAKAQLEVAKTRHAAAVSELKSVRDELEQLRRDYDSLIAEKDAAEKKAEEALFASKQVDKSVENLTIELITLKQSLDSAHSTQLEAEEHRIGAVMAKEQDSLNWDVELKQAEEELEKLNQQMIMTKELKSKLAKAMALLHDLKTELAAYMESKPAEDISREEEEDPVKQPETRKTRADIETAINKAKKELVDVKLKIDKATKEVNILKVASASLKSQLEKENAGLQTIQQREGMASIAAASLEAEINKIKSEINITRLKEKEERELVELPMQLQKAAQEAEQAKALARTAADELRKAKEEIEEAKAGVNVKESKLRTVRKEIETAKTSERLALAALSALQASEAAAQRDADEGSFNGITLSLEEYYELSKRAHEAEEQANTRVSAAMSQIEIAKESEHKCLNKLEEASRDMSKRKDALEVALQKAEEATQRKLSVEQELRKWRADHEQKRKNIEPALSPIKTSKDSKNHDSQRSPKSGTTSKGTDTQEAKGVKKKKKSFFPRIFMFLGKKKSHSSKGE